MQMTRGTSTFLYTPMPTQFSYAILIPVQRILGLTGSFPMFETSSGLSPRFIKRRPDAALFGQERAALRR